MLLPREHLTFGSAAVCVDGLPWSGSAKERREAFIIAAARVLAEFKVPIFEHLNRDDVRQNALAVFNVLPRSLDLLAAEVAQFSRGRVRLVSASRNEFEHYILGAAYLRVERGEKHALILMQAGEKPFLIDEGHQY